MRDALRRTPRVLLQRPTGSGKTVTYCAISAAVTSRSHASLILHHRHELIGQSAKLLAEMQVDYGIIAAGYPAAAAPVQIASINAVARRLQSYRPDDFKLVFVDEAHHARPRPGSG